MHDVKNGSLTREFDGEIASFKVLNEKGDTLMIFNLVMLLMCLIIYLLFTNLFGLMNPQKITKKKVLPISFVVSFRILV